MKVPAANQRYTGLVLLFSTKTGAPLAILPDGVIQPMRVIPMVLGAGHGALITRMRLQPFIITLCGLLIYRGLARDVADENTNGFGAAKFA